MAPGTAAAPGRVASSPGTAAAPGRVTSSPGTLTTAPHTTVPLGAAASGTANPPLNEYVFLLIGVVVIMHCAILWTPWPYVRGKLRWEEGYF